MASRPQDFGKFYICDPQDRPCAVLSDLQFWQQHRTDLNTWCREHDCALRGIVSPGLVEFPTPEVALLFVLRWQ